jgi:hypothetical protein
MHGCPVNDRVLDNAVKGGRLTIVELLVAHGLPSRPYLCAPTGRGEVAFGPAQLRCLQHLFDKGCPIHPGTLIAATRRGNVDAVRFLHRHGVPLWTRAEEHNAKEDYFPEPSSQALLEMNLSAKIIAIPMLPADAEYMWAALRYGAAMGAPLTPVMEQVFRAKRAATRTALLCFHVAHRLSRKGGHRKKRAAWAGMGAMPIEVIEKILVLGGFEISESLYCGLPRECAVKVEGPLSLVWWVKSDASHPRMKGTGGRAGNPASLHALPLP